MQSSAVYSRRVVSLFLLVVASSNSALFGQGTSVTAFYDNFDGLRTLAPGVTFAYSGITATESVQGYSATGLFSGRLLRNQTGMAFSFLDVPESPVVRTTLVLQGLPDHESIDLNFLFAAIDSWDGNTMFAAPDIFNVTVDNRLILSETFDNDILVDQSYRPGPGVLLTHRTHRGFNSQYSDSAYNLGLDPRFDRISHSGTSLKVEWYASGPGWTAAYYQDESWGIDNVEVRLNRHIDCPPVGWTEDVQIPGRDLLRLDFKGVSLGLRIQPSDATYEVTAPCIAVGSFTQSIAVGIGTENGGLGYGLADIAFNSSTMSFDLGPNPSVTWSSGAATLLLQANSPNDPLISVPLPIPLPPATYSKTLAELGLANAMSFGQIARGAALDFHAQYLQSIPNVVWVLGDPGMTALKVIDDQGLVTGMLANGLVVRQIPGSAYLETEAGPFVVIMSPDDDYQSVLRGLAPGDYQLISALVRDGGVVAQHNLAGYLATGQAHQFLSSIDADMNALTTRGVPEPSVAVLVAIAILAAISPSSPARCSLRAL